MKLNNKHTEQDMRDIVKQLVWLADEVDRITMQFSTAKPPEEPVWQYEYAAQRLLELFINLARKVRHQAARASQPKPPEKAAAKYKCSACRDTGKISWTDYSNGQGLDIECEDECDKCPPIAEVFNKHRKDGE